MLKRLFSFERTATNIPRSGPPRAAALAVSLLLALLIAYAFLWPRAAWLLVPARDRAPVNRALEEGAATFNTTPDDFRWTNRPTVFRLPDRICVLLVSRLDTPHGTGSGYKACYDARTGAVLEERAWL